MSALAHAGAVRLADPLDVLEARCWARAYLIAEGEIDDPVAYFADLACDAGLQVHVGRIALHFAVDELQTCAVRSGLIDAIGQDDVQALMAEAFAMRCDLRIAA